VQDNGGTAGGGLDTIVRKFTVNVAAVNQQPTLDTLGNIAILKNSGAQNVNLTGISAGPGDSQTISITATSDTPGLIPNPQVTYNSPAATGSLSFTPVANATGSATITVTVKDNGGTANGGADTIVRMFTITVNNPNQPPSFTKGSNQAVAMNAAAQSIANWATGISPGPPAESNQTVSFLVSADNTSLFSAQPAIDASGTLSFTPAANASGIATVTVRAKDNGGTAGGGNDTSAAQTFTILISGVSTQGNVMTVEGTIGTDSISLAYDTTNTFSVMFNGVKTSYAAGSSAGQVNQIVLHGVSGSDALSVQDTFNTRTASISGGTASFTGAGFTLSADGMTTISLFGNASGAATITDSAAGDFAIATPSYSYLRGPGASPFLYQVSGFGNASITVAAGSGALGFLYATAGGIATAQPTVARLQAGGTAETLNNFSGAYFQSSGSTSDQAYVYGTAGNDTYIGTPFYAYLTGSVNGQTYFSEVINYRAMYAFGQGGSDVAHEYDSSGNDLYISTPTYAYLIGGSGSTAFFNEVVGFATVNAHATQGGKDSAYLYDSSGNDTFTSFAAYSSMSAAGTQSFAYGFNLAVGESLAGSDTATLNDGSGNNNFFGSPHIAQMARLSAGNNGMAIGFKTVNAVQSAGSNDHKFANNVDYALTFTGTWL
jgi:hypothetical protein